MDQTASIRDRFGPAAAAYAQSDVHRAGADLEAMRARSAEGSRRHVLDVGCGAGHTALAFAPDADEVVAYDLTPAMLEQARVLAAERGLGNLRFETGDAASLPFDDASFDVVTSRLAAHHFEDPAASVREAARVLRPGGLFLLSDTIAPEAPVQDTFLNAFEVLRDPSHVRNHRVSEWRARFAAAGLSFESCGKFRISQSFDAWVERIGTAPDAVAGLRALFRDAPESCRAHFALEGEGDRFELEIGVFAGVRGASGRAG